MIGIHPGQEELVNGITTDGHWDVTEYDPGAGAAFLLVKMTEQYKAELEQFIADGEKLGAWWKERHGEDLLEFHGDLWAKTGGGGAKLAWALRFAQGILERVREAGGTCRGGLTHGWQAWAPKSGGRPRDALLDSVVQALNRNRFPDQEVASILGETRAHVRERIKRLRRLTGHAGRDHEDRAIVSSFEAGNLKINLTVTGNHQKKGPSAEERWERLYDLARNNGVPQWSIHLYVYAGLRVARRYRSWQLYSCQSWLKEFLASGGLSAEGARRDGAEGG
jgi:hypothetical protein